MENAYDETAQRAEQWRIVIRILILACKNQKVIVASSQHKYSRRSLFAFQPLEESSCLELLPPHRPRKWSQHNLTHSQRKNPFTAQTWTQTQMCLTNCYTPTSLMICSRVTRLPGWSHWQLWARCWKTKTETETTWKAANQQLRRFLPFSITCGASQLSVHNFQLLQNLSKIASPTIP